jgi:hypothetical protein
LYDRARVSAPGREIGLTIGKPDREHMRGRSGAARAQCACSVGRHDRAEEDRMTVRKIPQRNIALVLAAALLSASAATAQVAPGLPNDVLGHYWCFYRAPDDDPHLIFSADNFDACANRGGVRFWRRGGKSGFQLGRFDWRADCEISKIDLVGEVYRVHSYSRAKREMFVGDPLEGAKLFELWQSKTGMHWRELEEDRK